MPLRDVEAPFEAEAGEAGGTHRVAGRGHLADQAGAGRHLQADHREGRGHLVLREQPQDLRGVLRAGAVVDGQRDALGSRQMLASKVTPPTTRTARRVAPARDLPDPICRPPDVRPMLARLIVYST